MWTEFIFKQAIEVKEEKVLDLHYGHPRVYNCKAVYHKMRSTKLVVHNIVTDKEKCSAFLVPFYLCSE